MYHTLKIRENYLHHILEGRKSFEIRFNDRDYQVGDIIVFSPVDDKLLSVPNQYKEYVIDYIHSGLGLQQNYVAMSIKEIKHDRP